MVNKVLGECICPVCKSEYPQEIRTAKTGKPYMNCDECGCQIFARQPQSVKILRGLAVPVQQKQPEAAPVLAGQEVAKKPEKTHSKPAPVLAQNPQPAPPLMATPAEKQPLTFWG